MPGLDCAEAIIYWVQKLHFYESVDDLFELAAIYLVAIARGYIFNDGTKRTARAVSMLFLRRNGIVLVVTGSVLDDLTVNVTTGDLLVDPVLCKQYYN